MKKLILFFVFAAIVLQFTSCKVEDDPTNDNPDVTSVVIDTTLKSFYVKPTPSSTFESIYAFDFTTSPLFINSILFINLNWNDAVEEHGIYLNFTTTTGDALIDGNGFLKAFDSGIKIDSTLAGTWSGYDDGVFSYDYIANPSANKGNLAGQGDKYIVFRAYDGGSPQNKHYGWLRVNVAANGRDIKVLSIGFSEKRQYEFTHRRIVNKYSLIQNSKFNMALPSLYDKSVAADIISRINKLTPETQPKWGKMDVARMLAHSNVTYEYVFDERNDHPNLIMKFILKTFIKSKVVTETPYPQNGPTAPAFIIADARDFEKEKSRLIQYINNVAAKGASYFEGKASSSFGVLTAVEWNNMMYKHLNHHLTQFGV